MPNPLGWKSASPGSAAAAPPPPLAFPSASSVYLKLRQKLNALLGRNGGLETPLLDRLLGRVRPAENQQQALLPCGATGGGGETYKKGAFFLGE